MTLIGKIFACLVGQCHPTKRHGIIFWMIFCRSIEQTCKLYEYYESMLGEESGYYLPGATINPTNRIFGMYHSNCLLCEEISF